MKLEFLFLPTTDLVASLTLYREAFGFTELWREGDSTAALTLPGSELNIMLDASDPDAPAGPMFLVESVEAFHHGRPESLAVVEPPSEIPGGYIAVYQEPGGAIVYVLDQSTESAAS